MSMSLDNIINLGIEGFTDFLTENGILELTEDEINKILKELKDQLEYDFLMEGGRLI